MEISEILSLVSQPTELIKKIEATRTLPEPDLYFEPEQHKVMLAEERPDKTIHIPSGVIDETTGKEGTRTKTEKVARITLSLQKLIIDRSVAFATGVPIEYRSSPKAGAETVLDKMVRKTIRDNKCAYKDSEILELTMKDTECAEIWYSEEVEPEYWQSEGSKGDFRMRMKIAAPSLGDKLFPIWNMYGSMAAFARGYEIDIEGGKEQERMDVYTPEAIFTFAKVSTGWEAQADPKQRKYGKVQVIYHKQPRTETADVNGKIERLETLLSNHADTNDYNGSPILASSGEILGFSAKGETGKVFELENGAKLDYVTWDNAPASIKMEIENLIHFIFTETRTPNFTPEVINGLGAISGIALKLLFLDAHLKARKRQNGSFGESIQRRINFLKAACAVINSEVKSAVGLEITPVFGLYMPDNETETIDNIVSLVQAGILSKETALRKLSKMLDMEPDEVEAELERLQAERDSLDSGI